MTINAADPPRVRRFRWEALRGRARRRLVAGLLIGILGLGYGVWATRRLGQRGADRQAFDRPMVAAASRLVTAPDRRPAFEPHTTNELFLLAVITDQQDIVYGLTLLALRLLAAGTIAALGLVLITAGSTEWEVRSEPNGPAASRLGRVGASLKLKTQDSKLKTQN